MRSSGLSLTGFLLFSLFLAASCAGPPKQKTLYWRGEMWDGMNRMVFALQDLGWHLDTVDTDNGKIIASIPRDNGGGGTVTGGPGAGGDPEFAADPDTAASDSYRILIRFSEAPNVPISIGPMNPGDESYRNSKYLRMISDITKRFEWYGGKSVEVSD